MSKMQKTILILIIIVILMIIIILRLHAYEKARAEFRKKIHIY